MPHVVILGGAFAGVSTAHKLLKHTLAKVSDLKVTLVAPSSYLYWNFAAVRGVIKGELADDKLFTDLKAGFEQYPAGSFEFVEALAVSLDDAGNSVVVRSVATGEESTLTYDQLVIATGTSEAAGIPFKTLNEGYKATVDSLHELQDRVEKAKTIVVVGAGATGSETAAELGAKYGKTKTIKLVARGNVLPSLGTSAQNSALNTLKNLGVEVLTNSEYDGEARTIKTNGGAPTPLEADVVIPACGGKPNSEFIPASFLDDKKYVKTKVTLQTSARDNVWAVGDISNLENNQATRIDPQVAHLWGNLDLVLQGKSGLKSYAPSSGIMMFVSLGKSSGTGQVGSWRVWSWIVAMAKSKTLFVDKAKFLAAGQNGIRAAL